jgi:poly-gamma-glutamate synthesis protein (capsule biosynthesis protein)
VTSRRRFLQYATSLPLAGLAGCATVGAGRGGSAAALRVTLAGQALMKYPLCDEPYDGLDAVVAELRGAGTVFTDLEVAISTPRSGAPTRDNEFLHAAPPAVLDCLRAMGFNLLALSNNHAWDLGTEGVLATREEVAAAGFGFAGTGRDVAEAAAPGFVPVGPSVALVAMATGKIRDGAAATATRAGVNELRFADGRLDEADVARNLAALAAARRRADCVIAYLHNHQWGDDMRVTAEWSRAFARRCVDAGADVFASHGAPLLHGIEFHRGRPLLHGLGSLVFQSRTAPGHYPPEVWESAIVHCDFAGGRLAALRVVPVALNEVADDPARTPATRGRPRLATGLQRQQIVARLAGLSAALGTDLRIDEAGLVVAAF